MNRSVFAIDARVGTADYRNSAQEAHATRPPPSALLLRAWRSLIELRLDDALAAVGCFEREIGQLQIPIAPRLHEFAEVLRAVLLVFNSHDGATVRSALSVIEKRFRSTGMSPALATTLRVGYWKIRDFDGYYAVPRFKHHITMHRCTHWVASIIGPMFEAAVEAEQLRLTVARRLARSAHERALSRFGKRAPVTARAAVMLAELLYEEGRCDGVDTLAMDSLSTLRASGDEDCALRGYRVVARVAARRGDTEFAFLILNEAIVFAVARDWTRMLAEALMLRAQLLLKQGRIRDALVCADRIEVLSRDHAHGAHDAVHASLDLTRAQLMVATGNAGGGAKLLRELQEMGCLKRNHYWALQLSVLLSDALLACGNEAEGRTVLIQALQAGMRAGAYQSFVDAGTRVTDLMLALHHGAPGDSRLPAELAPYVDSILADRARQNAGAKPTRASRGTESLSPREQSILRSMSCGFSNKRIAQELQIAPETVKSHVKGIFIKLAVQTRAHAVSTGGALGLL
jgi:ATP/maltotriose-dependent transcriptional regulator MalT